MAAVQPHVAPRRHPPPAAVPPLQAAPSQAPAALLPCKRSRADAVAAVAHGRKERVAESCCPSSSRLGQLELEQLVLVDDDSGEEDDGCGSSVDGAGCAGGGQEDDDEEESGSGSRGVAWWNQDSVGRRCSLWANGNRTTSDAGQLGAGGERDDEDPTLAARRQEEDRKFWEACLASGYP